MNKAERVQQDLKDMARHALVEGSFAGGNAGKALAGMYIADSNRQIALAIEELARSMQALANRPINVTVTIPPKTLVGVTNKPKHDI